MRLAAPHPNGAAQQARICVADQCWQLAIGPLWRTYTLPFRHMPGSPLLVESYSDTFVAPDGRRVGVLIDSASAEGL